MLPTCGVQVASPSPLRLEVLKSCRHCAPVFPWYGHGGSHGALLYPGLQVTVACREAREGIQTRDVHLQLIRYTESWPQPSWNSVLRDSDNIEVTQPSPPSTRVETTETLFSKMAPKPHLYFADVLPESLGAQTLQASFLRELLWPSVLLANNPRP